ncbi:DNA primase [Roseovarius sp. A46]|uniref:DNA primase n=1 Tax=Roseovarius sp. A46 TaxID=2109331 RepID=UPI001010136B|nr:DNA primase [Roseovarius sp. A46]RXV64889.1 DNA primase [Roseovarius sp. A46]
MRMISLGLVTLCALLPFAATAQNSICEPTGEIVAAAVEARRDGQSAEAAKSGISNGLDASQEGYAPAVQLLVDWVYDLPEQDLQKDVAGAWVTQCKTQ